eukprot:Nk52_evm4s54 gene=Nk52_evmTU4s54
MISKTLHTILNSVQEPLIGFYVFVIKHNGLKKVGYSRNLKERTKHNEISSPGERILVNLYLTDKDDADNAIKAKLRPHLAEYTNAKGTLSEEVYDISYEQLHTYFEEANIGGGFVLPVHEMTQSSTLERIKQPSVPYSNEETEKVILGALKHGDSKKKWALTLEEYPELQNGRSKANVSIKDRWGIVCNTFGWMKMALVNNCDMKEAIIKNWGDISHWLPSYTKEQFSETVEYNSTSSTKRQTRLDFCPTEVENLFMDVMEYGRDITQILKSYAFNKDRSYTSIADKMKALSKQSKWLNFNYKPFEKLLIDNFEEAYMYIPNYQPSESFKDYWNKKCQEKFNNEYFKVFGKSFEFETKE